MKHPYPRTLLLAITALVASAVPAALNAADATGLSSNIEDNAFTLTGQTNHPSSQPFHLKRLGLVANLEVDGQSLTLDSRDWQVTPSPEKEKSAQRIRRSGLINGARIEIIETVRPLSDLPAVEYQVELRHMGGPALHFVKPNKFLDGVANHTHVGGGDLVGEFDGALEPQLLVRWNQFGARRWQHMNSRIDRFIRHLPFYDRKLQLHSPRREDPDLGVFLPPTERTPDIHTRWVVQAGQLRLGLITDTGEQLPFHLSEGGRIAFTAGFAAFSGDLTARESRQLLTQLAGGESAALDATAFITPAPVQSVAPNPPEILSPPHGAVVSPAASFFDWRGSEGARSYELEFTTDPAFRHHVERIEIVPEAEEQRVWYVPQKDLPTGQWYWRVRATDDHGNAGEWTQELAFEVAAWSEPRREPAREISAERPLFWFEAWNNRDRDGRQLDDVAPFWANIPEDLREYAAISTPLKREERTPSDFFASAVGKEVPFLWRTHGPGRQWDYNSLYEVEKIFREYANVLGIVVGEKFWPWSYRQDRNSGEFIEPDIATYTRRIIQLCRQYGKYYVWGDGNGEFFKWQMLANDPEWMEFFKENSSVMVIGGKTNITAAYHSSQGQTFGLWLSEHSANLAVYAEAWYWDHAGFGRPGEYFGYLQGHFHQMPPIFWALMWMPGMAQGATAFGLEGQWASTLHEYDPEDPFRAYYDGYWSEMQTADYTAIWDLQGRPTPILENVVLPFMRAVLRMGMIPTKDEVREHLRMAVVLDAEEPMFNFKPRQIRHRRTLGPFDALYRGTYGISEPGGAGFELIPNSGRYNFFPLFMEHQSFDLPEHVQVGRLNELGTATAVESFLQEVTPMQNGYTGAAWQLRLDDKLYIANSHENRPVDQDFRAALNWAPLEAIDGNLPMHGFLLGKMEDDRIDFFGHYGADGTHAIRLTCEQEPEIEWRQAEPVTTEWNENTRVLTLEFIPSENGWVDFSIAR